jgi:hypothetical protein
VSFGLLFFLIALNTQNPTASTGTGVSFFRAQLQDIGKESQKLDQLCPRWVSSCVMKSIFFPNDATKLSFHLFSENEKRLPSLPAKWVPPQLANVLPVL